MLKGQLPPSVRGLSSQGVELFGRGEALLDSVCKLPWLMLDSRGMDLRIV
jgi:hypothetical protein